MRTCKAIPFRPDSTALTDHEELFHVAADGQGMAAFGPSCCQYLPAVLGCHACPETVLVPSFPVMGLKCPFHCLKLLSNGLIKNIGHATYHFSLL
jgi:hypothetical protein